MGAGHNEGTNAKTYDRLIVSELVGGVYIIEPITRKPVPKTLLLG